MSGFEVWFLFTALPAVKSIIAIFSGFLVLYIVVNGMSAVNSIDLNTKEERDAKYKESMKKVYKGAFFMVLILSAETLVSDQKTTAAIIVVPAVTQSEKAQELGGKSMDASIGLFNQWVEDITKKRQSEN